MKRPRMLPRRDGTSAYFDALGHRWETGRLDRLLSEAPVRQRVAHLYRNAYDEQGAFGDFSAGAVWSWLKGEFGREEVVALYLLLVTRYRDTLPALAVRGGAP